jgi:hypothetical protein
MQFNSKIGSTSVTKSTGLAEAPPAKTKLDAKAPSAQHINNLIFKYAMIDNAPAKVNTGKATVHKIRLAHREGARPKTEYQQSLRQQENPIELLERRPEAVGCVQTGIAGREGAAQIGPNGRSQIGGGLHLVCSTGHRAPGERERSVGLRDRLEHGGRFHDEDRAQARNRAKRIANDDGIGSGVIRGYVVDRKDARGGAGDSPVIGQIAAVQPPLVAQG